MIIIIIDTCKIKHKSMLKYLFETIIISYKVNQIIYEGKFKIK
jgi:hypothetical protein